MQNVAIFASGSGSNAECIVRYFDNNPSVQIKLILSNRKDAFVLERAKQLNIPSIYFDRDTFYNTDNIIELIKEQQIDLIVLAGFLWKVPDEFVQTFPKRIINIHPALLPLHGGKGMYGHHVHQAVLDSGDKESGITVHYVNERYDEGECIFQARCEVLTDDTPDSLAMRVHKLEHLHFPIVIEGILKSFL